MKEIARGRTWTSDFTSQVERLSTHFWRNLTKYTVKTAEAWGVTVLLSAGLCSFLLVL